MAYGALMIEVWCLLSLSCPDLSCPVLSITGFSNVLLVVVCGLKTTTIVQL